MFAWLTPRFATLDAYPLTKENSMVQTDFRTALQGSNEIEITVTCPVHHRGGDDAAPVHGDPQCVGCRDLPGH